MSKETDITEDTEKEFTDPTGYVAELENYKSFKEMAEARGEGGEDDVDEAEVEEHEAVDIASEQPAVEPNGETPFLTLTDGTVLTKEETVAGYMRHIDYTQKRMEDSKTAKEMEEYAGLIEAMKSDRTLFDMVDNYVKKGDKPAPPPSDAMAVPADYKNDPVVPGLVENINKLTRRLDMVEGGVGGMKQDAVTQQRQAEAQTVYEGRLKDAYDKLQGQLGDSTPSPADFVNKVKTHFEGKGLTPEQYMPMIIGPDSTYLSANVSETFRDDIGKVVKDKVNSTREKRKPKGAERRALKATGKPPKPASHKTPRLPDGSLDIPKFMDENPVWAKEKPG